MYEQDSGNYSARWATTGELQRDGWLHPSGWPLGLTACGPVYVPTLRQRAGTLVFAPPDAGKSRGILVPAILSEARHVGGARRSLIVLDPDGELYRLTARTLARTHTVLCWNPAKPHMCNTYFDPLAYVGSPNDASFVSQCELVAGSWYTAMAAEQQGRARGDAFWDTQPIAALTALILARVAAVPGLTMTQLVNFVLPLSPEKIGEYVRESGLRSARLYGSVIGEQVKGDGGMQGGIYAELRRRLLAASNPTVAATIGRPSIDVAQLVARPTILYLQAGTNERTIQPLLSVALSTLVGQLQRLSTAGRPLAREVRIIVDELANIGELYDVASAINTLRKYGIGFLLTTQSRAGLYAVYGQAKGDKIIDACNTLIGLGGLAPDDAYWMSNQLGVMEWQEVTPEYQRHLYSLHMPSIPTAAGPVRLPGIPIPYKRTHYHRERRRVALKSPDALRAMDRQAVVIPTRLRPFEVGLQLYTGA